MSDENKESPAEKETQQVPPPRSTEKHPDDSTLSFDNARRRRKEEIDPTKDTAVLSRNNPLLRRALNATGAEEDFNGTTTLGDKREVILLIRGMVERVLMEEGIIYKLGRFEIGTAAEDEIDLTPYGAMDRGVSRVHSQLHLEDGKVFITDLGSTNGTYISGTRLEPETPTALRKGDELLLGRLAVQILFR